MFGLGEFIALLLLGGWVAIDATTVGQFMISRPLVAATFAGWIVGAPALGAVVGLLLEAFQLMVLPVGAARYPEGGPPAVIAAAVYANTGADSAVLLATVVFALAWEWVSGMTVRRLRQINARFLPAAGPDGIKPASLQGRHFAAVAADFLRGVLLVGFGLLLLAALIERLAPLQVWSDGIVQLLLRASGAAALAAGLHLFGTNERRRLFAGGILAGLLFLALR